MKYFANGTIRDYPTGTQFVRWDNATAETALKVARREMARLYGWEAGPSRDQTVQLLVSALAYDKCGLYSVHSTNEDQDWPRYACFCSWAFCLSPTDFDRLLNDINSGNCQWCSVVIPIVDQQCCQTCARSHIANDPCLQGSGRAENISFVLGTPHNFSLCGMTGPLPSTWGQAESLLELAKWLGASSDKSFSGGLVRSVSGQPLPPAPQRTTYSTTSTSAPDALSWGWVAAASVVLLGAITYGVTRK
jgi:hypothetical protein